MSHEHLPADASQIESVILHELKRLGACTFDELVRALPDYSWNQVFMAVDQLSRDGRLLLTRQGRFDYLISIGPPRTAIPRGQYSGRS
jgi:hypothetical protein